MHTFDAEIFAVGKWNGMSFTADDLDKIVDTFNDLKDIHKVPLKFGHNDEQKVTDGQPALGWVEAVYRKGTKLFGKFVDVPNVVKDAIMKKLYRKVSIELDLDVKHKNTNYRHVLSAVALLGADLPAVNTLADLTAYMGRGKPLASSGRGVFSAISGQTNEDSEMDEEALKKLMQSTVDAALAPIKKENDELRSANAQFSKQIAERDEADRKEKVAFARKQATERLEAAVKQGLIKPAQRISFAKSLKLDDDAAVLKVTQEDIDGLVGSEVRMDFTEKGKGGGTGSGAEAAEGAGAAKKREHEDPGLEIHRRTEIELNRSGGKLTYSQARDVVLADDGELAREYINANSPE